MRELIKDRNSFIELIERIPVRNFISMKVLTWAGSYLEGVSSDYLKYVYNKEKDTDESSDWQDYTIVYKDFVSPDSILSDFDELQSNSARNVKYTISVIYDEAR